jgi:hypothetical protein
MDLSTSLPLLHRSGIDQRRGLQEIRSGGVKEGRHEKARKLLVTAFRLEN